MKRVPLEQIIFQLLAERWEWVQCHQMFTDVIYLAEDHMSVCLDTETGCAFLPIYKTWLLHWTNPATALDTTAAVCRNLENTWQEIWYEVHATLAIILGLSHGTDQAE